MNTVMIVDDHKIIRLVLKKSLAMNNYKVVDDLDDGTMVLLKYKILKPDIVIMDLNMPRQDGLTTIKQIMDFDPEAKIIVCSAVDIKDKVIQAIKLGARGYVLKPINTKELIATIQKVLSPADKADNPEK